MTDINELIKELTSVSKSAPHTKQKMLSSPYDCCPHFTGQETKVQEGPPR